MAVTQKEAECWGEEYALSGQPFCVNQFADVVESAVETDGEPVVPAEVEYQVESSSESPNSTITGQPFVWDASEPRLHGQFSENTDIQCSPSNQLDEEDGWEMQEEDDEITYAGVLEYS